MNQIEHCMVKNPMRTIKVLHRWETILKKINNKMGQNIITIPHCRQIKL